MIQALLFDLDDTLLENPMSAFVPAYMAAFGEHVAGHFDPRVFLRHLLDATEVMVSDTDPSRTNREAFDAAFFPAISVARSELEPLIEGFYARRFPRLQSLTRPVPAARPLMEWVFEHPFQVAIATNPLFPLTAIEQRLAWAGVPVDDFAYDLVTSYEQMHAAKPHPEYYLEIAQRLDRRADECLMIGDDWQADILPAAAVGMRVYWIAAAGREPPSGVPLDGSGTLADLANWLRTGPDQGARIDEGSHHMDHRS